jgi:hypothetical protein
VGSVKRTHRILCDRVKPEVPGLFKKQGDRVIIQFTLKHDLDNGPGEDDLDIIFRSTVKLRG